MRLRLSHARMDRRPPLREQIYSVLRNLVVTGAIAPGETIDEKEIAHQLGVSRTPVREALKKLSDEHLVDVVAQSGTHAARIDRAEVEQAFLIRRALEMETAAQAAANISPNHAYALSDLLTLHERAIDRKDHVEAIKIDDNFHRYIAEISHLPRLWRAIEISKAHLDRCRHLMLLRPGEADATLEQHREIIRALNSKDQEKARAAMARHLEAAYQNAIKVLSEEPASHQLAARPSSSVATASAPGSITPSRFDADT